MHKVIYSIVLLTVHHKSESGVNLLCSCVNEVFKRTVVLKKDKIP